MSLNEPPDTELGLNPKDRSLSKRFNENVNPQRAQERNNLLRDIPIYPGVKEALANKPTSQIERSSPVNIALLDPALAEMVRPRPTTKINEVTSAEGVSSYVISSPINEHLSSVMVLNPQVNDATEITLGADKGLGSRPEYKYMTAQAILIVNSNGQVVNLDQYVPLHPRNREKEIRIVLNNKNIGFSRIFPRRMAIQPVFTITDFQGAIHEAGHLWQHDVNPYDTKYSVERDAAAFMITAVRELEKRGFLIPQEVEEMIKIQRDSLQSYQNTYGPSKDYNPGMMRILAPEQAYTKEAVHHSRFLESQKRKPPEERKQFTPQYERLLDHLKEFIPEFFESAHLMRTNYPAPENRYPNPKKSQFFKTPGGLFKISIDVGTTTLTEYLSGDNERINIREYTVHKDKFFITEAEATPENPYHATTTQVLKLEALQELPREVQEFEGAIDKVKVFFDNLQSGKVEVFSIDQSEGFDFIRSSLSLQKVV